MPDTPHGHIFVDAEKAGGQRRTPAEKVADGRVANRAACACGCGGTPKSQKARYLPGHDAKHHAALNAGGKRVTFITPADKREKTREANRQRRAGTQAVSDTG